MVREEIQVALPDAVVIAAAPGRVNLLGEHTDYNGFGVLPMAIPRRVWIAMAPRDDDTLIVRNLDPDQYPSERIPLAEIATRPRAGSWVDYVVAAARARPPAHGMELVVGSDLAAAAGLASSAALVVASMLALGPDGDRLELAEQARVAELYIGTNVGGMDQAVSLLGRRGHALAIDFRPLAVWPVVLPADFVVIVANSGVAAAKGGDALVDYNNRVENCAVAAAALGAPADGVLADVPVDDRDERVADLSDPVLRRRARFVFAEAARRDAGVTALEAGDLRAFGELLNASHAGLRDEFEVSHPAVDALVVELRAAGAFGARIVGAGFGGCAVAVADRAGARDILARVPDSTAFAAADGAGRRQLG